MRLFLLILASVFLLNSADEAVAAARSDPLSRLLGNEPAFSEIVRAALREENLDLNSIRQWKKRMKIAPLFPTLAVGYDRTLRETDVLSITDNISVTSSAVTVGPQGSDLDQTILQGDVLKFRAAWSLSDLLFHPSSLAASRESREMTESRFTVNDSLFKIHSERRLLIREWSRHGRKSGKTVGLCDKIFLLTEKLDSLTANLFADRWWSCASSQ